ncbi:hypothetical protein FWG76_01835 [Candidatus Saccharibacteria bacterium]|nr:hypothetical protein [Candidatus Saccharibacteria bacterium]
MNDNLIRNLGVVKVIADRIGERNIRWILSGSTSLRLQGVDVDVNDIDIVTDEHGARGLDELLAAYRTKKSAYSSTENYRSIYGKYRINDVDVDIMANFQYKLKSGEWSDINVWSEVGVFDYNGMRLPVLSLEQELKEYESMGRADKAARIKARINELFQ